MRSCFLQNWLQDWSQDPNPEVGYEALLMGIKLQGQDSKLKCCVDKICDIWNSRARCSFWMIS